MFRQRRIRYKEKSAFRLKVIAKIVKVSSKQNRPLRVLKKF